MLVCRAYPSSAESTSGSGAEKRGERMYSGWVRVADTMTRPHAGRQRLCFMARPSKSHRPKIVLTPSSVASEQEWKMGRKLGAAEKEELSLARKFSCR
jgi:hypothetical protein